MGGDETIVRSGRVLRTQNSDPHMFTVLAQSFSTLSYDLNAVIRWAGERREDRLSISSPSVTNPWEPNSNSGETFPSAPKLWKVGDETIDGLGRFRRAQSRLLSSLNED